MLEYKNENDLDKVIQFTLNKVTPKRTPQGEWQFGKRNGSTNRHFLNPWFGEDTGHLREINPSAAVDYAEKPYNKPVFRADADQGNYIGLGNKR